MAEEIPEALVRRFQQIQQQLQALMMQKQNIQIQQAEVENALKELKTSKETELYEIIGTVMIKRTKNELTKSLKEKSDIFGLRLSSLDKQIDSLSSKAKETQDEIIAASKKKGA
jgi:prefoldin beta subunit